MPPRKRLPPIPTEFPGQGMPLDQWEGCVSVLAEVYQATEEGRQLADIFRVLPDRRSFPDYFEAISEPESLDNVASRLARGEFDDAESFFKQLQLIFSNAKYYNEEDSQIWNDAQRLDEIIEAARQLISRIAPAGEPVSRGHSSAEVVEVVTVPSAPSPKPAIDHNPQVTADQAVIAALDARLPRWEGPLAVLHPTSIEGIQGSGWWGEGAPSRPSNVRAVMEALDRYKHDNIRLAEVFDPIPPVTNIPYLSFDGPISFSSIKINIAANRYRTLRDLDIDMSRLFEKARRFYAEGSTDYGRVLILQRLYNALTAPYPLVVSGTPEPSPTLFASLPAGPGNARSLHETTQELRAGAADVGFGITTFRVGTKDRIFTSEARHKGMAYRLGDFIHLINPDDATKPIVGQIFKTFVPTKGFRTHHVTVCWYYRPEQTVHTADRKFFDREVFKTSHLCDHPVEDIIERIGVQFYVKWIRGKAKAPEYYPGWPNYICHSRYNDKLWSTVRIKNWGSCIPDELRQTDFMAVNNYDRQVEPEVVTSPFHRGITGPGFFGEPKGKATEEDEEEPKPRMSSTPAKVDIPARPIATPIPPVPAYRPPVNGWSSSSKSIAALLGGSQILDQVANKELLPAETTVRLFERDSRGQVLWYSGPPLSKSAASVPAQAAHSLEYLNYLTKRKLGDVPERQVFKRKGPSLYQGSEPWWSEGMSEDEVLRSWQRL